MQNNNLLEERKKDIKAIKSLLSKSNRLNESNIIALTGSFGTGKTFFIKNMLMDEISDMEVWYCNIWKYDLTAEPLLFFLNDLYKYLVFISGEDRQYIKNKISGISKIAQIFCKAHSSGYFNPNDLEQSLIQLGEAPERYKEINTISEAQLEFSKIILEIIGSQKEIVIIIDEIERAKPDFSLLFLESIKHLFSHGQVKFIISTDIDYLSAAVKHFYGEAIKPDEYLRKFFNYGYKLSKIKNYDSFISESEYSFCAALQTAISIAALAAETDLRTLERLLYHCASTLDKERSIIFDYERWLVEEKRQGGSIDFYDIMIQCAGYVYIFIFTLKSKASNLIDSIDFKVDNKNHDFSSFDEYLMTYLKNLEEKVPRVTKYFYIFFEATLSCEPKKVIANHPRLTDSGEIKACQDTLKKVFELIDPEFKYEEYVENFNYPVIKAILNKMHSINFFI